MPTPAAPAVVQAADAVTATASTPEGVTPPNADSARMSTDQARDILRGAGKNSQRHEPDPLTDEGDGRDPLTDEGVTLEEVLGIGPETDQAETEDQAAPAAGAEAEAATLEEQVAIAEEAAKAAAKAEKEERVRLNSTRRDKDGNFVYPARERAIMNLSEEKGISLTAAEIELFGERQPAASEKAADAAPVPREPTAAEIDAQLADLEKKIEEAEDTLDYPAQAKLNREMRLLLPKRQDALIRDMRNQQAQQETRQTVAQQQETSRVKALAAYPDAGKEGTPLQIAAQARINRIWQEQSPLMSEPDLFETVVAMEAVRLGVTPTIAAKAAVPAKAALAKPAVPVVPTKRATPMPAPGSVSAPAAKVDPRADLEARINATRDPAVLKGLMREAAKLERAA